ncbi:hypothetical protein JMJ58_10835 [Haloterrigena salifodinae]|uniref:DUF1102 domain-containing protein n=1 Tax=Haloterrigena salifodinae TaxID=2675099 RepID=A0A8T8DVB9_9EURY|nr:hypothetical protein [Haloterrigena salifodinae]QRV13464.1 hypothetical protein JMJ58_10835 [Haloterrigena salifodinae]
MKRRVFMCVGATSIGVGALFSTGAFSSLTADRGVAVTTAEDHEGALLGIKNIDTTDEPVFTNNTTLEMDVRLTDTDPDTTISFDGNDSSYRFSLGPNGSETITVETEDTAQSALVAVTAELFDNGTKSGEITLQRDFSAPQSAITDFTGTAKSPGGSGKFEFELENTGDKPITLTGIGIDATTRSDVQAVTPKNNGAALSGNKRDLVTTSITIDSTDPESHSRYGFDTDFELSLNETASFELSRFTDGSGNKVSMDGENVRVTVYFGDDSHKTFDLCLDEATCGRYES